MEGEVRDIKEGEEAPGRRTRGETGETSAPRRQRPAPAGETAARWELREQEQKVEGDGGVDTSGGRSEEQREGEMLHRPRERWTIDRWRKGERQREGELNKRGPSDHLRDGEVGRRRNKWTVDGGRYERQTEKKANDRLKEMRAKEAGMCEKKRAAWSEDGGR